MQEVVHACVTMFLMSIYIVTRKWGQNKMSLQNISTLYLVLIKKIILPVDNKKCTTSTKNIYICPGKGPKSLQYKTAMLWSKGFSGTRQTKVITIFEWCTSFLCLVLMCPFLVSMAVLYHVNDSRCKGPITQYSSYNSMHIFLHTINVPSSKSCLIVS